LPFGQPNPHFSTHQKPIWEVNSSMASLPFKPNMAYARDNSTTRGQTALNNQAVPSQSRFPPPNRIRTPSPIAEPVFFYRNQSSESKVGTQVQVIEQSQETLSDSSLGFPIDGPRTVDVQSQQQSQQLSQQPQQAHKPSFSSEKQPQKKGELLKDSRFSWTNSQAPKSPPEASMYSLGTSGSSVARYMTVESWVGQQTNRLVEYQIQQLFDDIIDDRDRGDLGVSPKSQAPITAAVLPLYASNEILENSMTKEAGDGPKNLMPHPGTEVPIPKQMRIPSAILDDKLVAGRF
jgi:hypothetical protein